MEIEIRVKWASFGYIAEAPSLNEKTTERSAGRRAAAEALAKKIGADPKTLKFQHGGFYTVSRP